ncbi:MAG: hypothetical protein JNL08_10200 [Planctomycetes bacterium]|nr:hypothetical protein [Planctomycetota bacterium]
MHTSRSFALALTLATSLLAQDPPAPPGGFAVSVQTTVITFSDHMIANLDLYTPNAAAGPTGWPGVLVLPDAGGTKNDAAVVAAATQLAAAGYVAYAFTDPVRLTPTPERTLLDSAESHLLAQLNVVGTTIDAARLAVTGFGAGGDEAFAAAAWSGLALPQTGFVTVYPPVLAIAPQLAQVDLPENAVPAMTMVADHFVIGRQTVPLDFYLLLASSTAFPALHDLLETDYTDDLLTNLGTSTVPVLSMVAMQDTELVTRFGIDALLSLPQGPKRLFLSTGGHGTVPNAMETAVMHDLRRRWFDRFVKGIPNGIDLEPPVEVAMQPPSTAQHLDPSAKWEHRTATEWPPAIATTRWHLAGTQALQSQPPTVANLTNVIQHVVPVGYNLIDYVDNGAGLAPNSVSANIAPSQQVFFSPPLTETIEILGRPEVTITVDDTTGDFQLTAVLAHQDPTGTVHWITSGTDVEFAGFPDTYTRTIELADVGQIVPAGNRLVVRIQNLADMQGPGTRRIRIVPQFSSTQSTLQIGPGNDNFLDLPQRPYTAALLPHLAHVSAAPGFAHAMQLRAGAARAGRDYLLALGVTGAAPGFVLDGVQVPMNFDAFTGIGLSLVNTPILPNSAGVLDAAGNADTGFQLPGSIASLLQGLRFTFTGIVYDAGGLCDVVGGPATLVIDP